MKLLWGTIASLGALNTTAFVVSPDVPARWLGVGLCQALVVFSMLRYESSGPE